MPWCQTEGCSVHSCFGIPGSSPVSCATHKTEGMVDVVHRGCFKEGCSKRPSYGPAGPDSRPTACATHRSEGWVDVKNKRSYFRRCLGEGCELHPVFGFPGNGSAGAQRCGKHKLKGQVDVVHPRCQHEGCSRRPSFGFWTAKKEGKGSRKPTRCQSHKLSGMVDVKNPRCESRGCVKARLAGRRTCRTHSIGSSSTQHASAVKQAQLGEQSQRLPRGIAGSSGTLKSSSDPVEASVSSASDTNSDSASHISRAKTTPPSLPSPSPWADVLSPNDNRREMGSFDFAGTPAHPSAVQASPFAVGTSNDAFSVSSAPAATALRPIAMSAASQTEHPGDWLLSAGEYPSRSIPSGMALFPPAVKSHAPHAASPQMAPRESYSSQAGVASICPVPHRDHHEYTSGAALTLAADYRQALPLASTIYPAMASSIFDSTAGRQTTVSTNHDIPAAFHEYGCERRSGVGATGTAGRGVIARSWRADLDDLQAPHATGESADQYDLHEFRYDGSDTSMGPTMLISDFSRRGEAVSPSTVGQMSGPTSTPLFSPTETPRTSLDYGMFAGGTPVGAFSFDRRQQHVSTGTAPLVSSRRSIEIPGTSLEERRHRAV